MAFSTLPSAGDILTAAKLSALITELRPVFARKTADETVNNSATLQNDDALLLSVEANCTYELTGLIKYDSGTTPDIKFKFTVPAAATMVWAMFAQASGAFLGYMQDETTTAVNDGLGTNVGCFIKGVLVVGANAGTLQLQWAQNTANASNTIVRAGSYLKLQRMS